jgi:hypothetical protein
LYPILESKGLTWWGWWSKTRPSTMIDISNFRICCSAYLFSLSISSFNTICCRASSAFFLLYCWFLFTLLSLLQLLRWSMISVNKWGTTAIMFLIYHNFVSLMLFALFLSSMPSSMLPLSCADILLCLGITIAIAVLFGLKPEYFGYYKKAFKNDIFTQSHYWILMAGWIIIAIIMVGTNPIDYVGFISMVVPIACLIYLCVRRPYIHLYNNLRAITN